MRRPRQAARWVGILAITVMLTGCGGTTPTEAAPELARQLDQVDRAVVTGDEARIRARVESLESATEAARDAGRLDDEQADRILAAAQALLSSLPEEAPSPKSSPTASPSPTLTPAPAPDEGEEDEGDEGDGGEEKSKHKEPKPEPEKKEKGKGKKH